MKITSLATTTLAHAGAWASAWRRTSVARRMFLVALVCQLATVYITWPVWNVRESPVNLPLVPTPAVSFGWPIVLSLIAAAIWPRLGLALHAALWAVSCVFDQFRVQPQFLSLIVLMWACVSQEGAWFGRWYLAALWVWAGLHKLVSADWFGHLSWTFLEMSGIPPGGHVVFAAVAGLTELAVGLLAIWAPRRAAVPCLVMHLGIALLLSPLVTNQNASVWPWNLATAIVGFWLLRQSVGVAHPTDAAAAPRRWRPAVLAALFVMPLGYYFGLVNAHLAFVLYSGNMPYALHTSAGTLQRLDGWAAGLKVPFPDSPRLFAQLFERTAAPGDKLHVADPRWWLGDRYFVKAADGSVEEISREQFCRADAATGEVAGIELESPAAAWRIKRAGGRLEGERQDLAHTASLVGPAWDEATLRQVSGLRNLRELKLERIAAAGPALAAAADLRRLQILEIKDCPLSDRDLQALAGAPALSYLKVENAGITSDALKVLDHLPQLQALHLPATAIDDRALPHIGALKNLRWLDLRDTRVTGAGLVHLESLMQCEWIDLSGTEITAAGLVHLRGLTRCTHLFLNQTLVGDDAAEHLRALGSLRRLELAGTRVTAEGRRRIREALPGCAIAW